MALSRIPNWGLVHRVDVVRKADADDGAGGIVPGTATTIYSARKARITVMKDLDEQQLFGGMSGQHWRVIVIYSANIQREDFLNLSKGSREAPISTTGVYRILWVKHQIDHTGRFHHTSLVVELE